MFTFLSEHKIGSNSCCHQVNYDYLYNKISHSFIKNSEKYLYMDN